MSVFLSVCEPVCLYVCLYICLSVNVVSPLRVLQPRLAIWVENVGRAPSRTLGLVPCRAVIVAC